MRLQTNLMQRLRIQPEGQVFTTVPTQDQIFMNSNKTKHLDTLFTRKKQTNNESTARKRSLILTASIAAHLDVPDEVVALLRPELVPEREGALLAVVLEPLQQLLRRRRARAATTISVIPEAADSEREITRSEARRRSMTGTIGSPAD
jgi:hypothetical protein